MPYQAKRTVIKTLQSWLFLCPVVVIALLAAIGCNQKERVVDLYVDAVMFKELDQNEEAIGKLNTAVELDKKFSPAYSLLGEIYQNMNQYEQSAASYEKATQINPWSFKDQFGLGRVHQSMKKFGLAVQSYVKACEIKPEHFGAHLGAAQSYYELQDYPNATTYGERAVEIDPNVGEVQMLLGDIYNVQKDYEQAIGMYKRSLETDASDANVMIALAVAYVNTDRCDPARELLNEVVRVQPENGRAWRYLGFTHLQSNDVEQAMESYTKALAIDETDLEAMNGLGVAYMIIAIYKKDNSIRDKAVAQWTLSLQLNPEQANSQRLRGVIYKYSK